MAGLVPLGRRLSGYVPRERGHTDSRGNLEHLRNECRRANAKDMPEYDDPATRDAHACDFLVTSLAQIDPGASDETLAQAVANIFNCVGGYRFATHSFPPGDGRPRAPLRRFHQPESIDDFAWQQHARFVELLLAGHEYRIEFSQGYVEVGNLDTIRGWVGYRRRDPAKTKEFLKIWIARDMSLEAEESPISRRASRPKRTLSHDLDEQATKSKLGRRQDFSLPH